MTHCSVCGRKLRPKRMRGWAGPNHSFPGWWIDWLNHARDCQRYGFPPDAQPGA